MTFLFCHLTLLAQNKNIDSILGILETAKPDTNKVNLLNRLSSEYINIREYDGALKYGNKALALASSVLIENKRGWSKGISRAYGSIGIVYYYQSNYNAALKNYFASLKIMKEIGDKRGIARSYNSIGNIYLEQGEYSPAIKYYTAALKMHEDIGDKKSISKTYNSIGNAYSSQDNYPEALKNYFASLKIREEINDKQGIAISYNNIGAIYDLQGNYTEALKNYFASLRIKEKIGDNAGVANSYNNIGLIYQSQENYTEALKNHFAALKISEDIKYKDGMAVTLENIGAIYSSQGSYPEALKMFFSSLKINEQIGDKYGIAASYNNIGNALVRSGQLKEAQSYLNKALQISKEIGSKYDIKKSYKGLVVLDSIQGNWRAAFEHHKLFIVYKDSIDNEETKKEIIESTMTNKFEKTELETQARQDKKDAIAAEEKQKQKIIKYSVSLGLFLVVLLALFILKGYRQKQKANIIISQQKTEVEKQKELVEEKHKEITDSINYAERIQRSFLASKELLTENLGDHFVLFQPKDVVSGDFYWASKLGNGNFALVTADSTGHGVPGAIMSILNISSLEKAVEQGLCDPSEILGQTRKTIIERLKKDGSKDGGKDGMDVSIICYDFTNQKFTYAAANNPIWVIRENEFIELKPDKMPVGKHDRDQTPFTQHEFQLQKGDAIYTLTDGFPDQFGGPEGKKFMSKQLKEYLMTISMLPMQEQKQKLNIVFDNWKGNMEQVDDVCLIGIRV